MSWYFQLLLARQRMHPNSGYRKTVSSKQEKAQSDRAQVGSLTLLSALLVREVLAVGGNGSGVHGITSFFYIPSKADSSGLTWRCPVVFTIKIPVGILGLLYWPHFNSELPLQTLLLKTGILLSTGVRISAYERRQHSLAHCRLFYCRLLVKQTIYLCLFGYTYT